MLTKLSENLDHWEFVSVSTRWKFSVQSLKSEINTYVKLIHEMLRVSFQNDEVPPISFQDHTYVHMYICKYEHV